MLNASRTKEQKSLLLKSEPFGTMFYGKFSFVLFTVSIFLLCYQNMAQVGLSFIDISHKPKIREVDYRLQKWGQTGTFSWGISQTLSQFTLLSFIIIKIAKIISSTSLLFHSKNIHFQIISELCNQIGSQGCDLFTNRTNFCPKSHLFLANWEGNTKPN